MEKLKNAICVWDVTISYDKNDYTRENLVKLFNEKFKKWCFQLEVGASGYKHWQCRVSTKMKSRSHPIIKGVHPNAWSPTSNENHGNNYYVMKEDTRLEGPWTDKDEIKTLTTQLIGFELSPWMQHVLMESKEFNLRRIDIIYDPIGNNGKSLFTEHMEYIGLAEEIPPFRNMEDIFQWVYGRPKQKCYMIDMPRGMKKDKLGEFYSGIEVIKNGVAYDKRHYPKKARFDRPRVFVFTNTLPVFELLSMDRWKVWCITNDELKEYVGGPSYDDPSLLHDSEE